MKTQYRAGDHVRLNTKDKRALKTAAKYGVLPNRSYFIEGITECPHKDNPICRDEHCPGRIYIANVDPGQQCWSLTHTDGICRMIWEDSLEELDLILGL